jgi:hypothetical protein
MWYFGNPWDLRNVSIWHVVFWHPWDLRNVYKDMINNMISLIYHVVMNHQNQTQTNGKWGHVRYNCANVTT